MTRPRAASALDLRQAAARQHLQDWRAKIDDIEFVRTVAVARITMPLSMVRLSAGRESMSEGCQALCFLAGANSIFTADKLLTAMKGEEPMRTSAELETIT